MNDDKLVIPCKNPKGEEGYKTFSIRIKDELVAKIDDISAKAAEAVMN